MLTHLQKIRGFTIILVKLKQEIILAAKHFSSIMAISSCFRFQAYEPYGRLGIGIANPRLAIGIRRSECVSFCDLRPDLTWRVGLRTVTDDNSRRTARCWMATGQG